MEIIIILVIIFAVINQLVDADDAKKKKRKHLKRKSTSEQKGAIGEQEIVEALNGLKGYGRIVRNIYIKKKDGYWTEIDIVLIHESGVYVFESKAHRGWIFGDVKNRTWTQSFGKGKTQKFPNPIWQNKGHAKALEDKIARHIPVHSLIVFTEATLKDVTYNPTDHLRVLEITELKDVMEDMTTGSFRLTRTKVNNIQKQLKRYTNPPQHVIDEHRRQIEERFGK